jgi:hypothetical protein
VTVVSSEHAAETNTETVSSQGREWIATVGSGVDRRTVVTGTGLVALFVVAIRSTIRLLGNVPFDPVTVSPSTRTGVAVATPLTVGTVLAVIALTDDRPTVRVGLLVASVFGVLGEFAPAATLPAVVAVVLGSALALVSGLGRAEELSYRVVRRRLLAAGIVTAIALSLADSTGLVPGLHGAGSLFALSAVALVGTWAEQSFLPAIAGVLAGGVVVYAGITSPFVLGSALLVVFAVTGVPHLLFALAVAGGTAAATAGFSRGLYPLAIGACLLVLAGVPVTLPRAMTLLLGAVLVTLDWNRAAEVNA